MYVYLYGCNGRLAKKEMDEKKNNNKKIKQINTHEYAFDLA